MKVLITGGAGQLGSVLCACAPGGVEVVATKRTAEPPSGVRSVRVELSDRAAVGRLLDAERPDVVIHTAYSVAHLQRDVIEATTNVAMAAASAGAKLVYMSTDALFSGLDPPYEPTTSPDPIHEYGVAKAQAEQIVVSTCPDAAVIRTSLICSYQPPYGGNGWIVAELQNGNQVTLFSNEIRLPIMVSDLATQVWDLAQALAGAESRTAAGVWHLIGPEAISRVEVGLAHCAALNLDSSLILEALSDPQARPTDLTLVRSRSPLLSCEPSSIATVGPHG